MDEIFYDLLCFNNGNYLASFIKALGVLESRDGVGGTHGHGEEVFARARRYLSIVLVSLNNQYIYTTFSRRTT